MVHCLLIILLRLLLHFLLNDRYAKKIVDVDSQRSPYAKIQGVIVWDIEGQGDPWSTYDGSPNMLPQVCNGDSGGAKLKPIYHNICFANSRVGRAVVRSHVPDVYKLSQNFRKISRSKLCGYAASNPSVLGRAITV